MKVCSTKLLETKMNWKLPELNQMKYPKATRSNCKWPEVAGSDQKWPEVTGHYQKWPEVAKSVKNCHVNVRKSQVIIHEMSWKFREPRIQWPCGTKHFIFFLVEQKGVTINKGGSIIHESYWYKWANNVLSMQNFCPIDINLHKKLVQFYVRFFYVLKIISGHMCYWCFIYWER